MMPVLQERLELAKKPRRGSVYVAVLGVSLIVAVIGIASVHVARLEVREAKALNEMAKARLASRSGVECALSKLKTDTLWRTTHSSGVANVLSGLSNILGTGSNSYTLIDDDGDLSDDSDDLVTLRCVGTSGDARHVIEVLLAPTGDGLPCLSAAMHTGGNIDVYANLTTNQTISANGNISCSGAGFVNGNAQACGSVSPPGQVSGTKNSGMTTLQMPDPEGAFEYYLAVGTPISYGSLSSGVINRVVLSATNNPFGGATNQQGIYVIECQGGNVTIRESRILATLVLLNAGQVEVASSINWEPFVANFPALMVEGSVLLNCTQQQALSEATNTTNYNPSHTPYLAQSDNSYSDGDTYPSTMTGLVYVKGDLSVTNLVAMNGVVVVDGNATINSNSTFNYKSIFYSNPPPGFTAGNVVKVVPGTWKQASY